MMAISIVLVVVSNYYLFKCAFTEPGIIPRGNIAEPVKSEVQTSLDSSSSGSEIKISVQEMAVETSASSSASTAGNDLKYCTTCHIYRPHRSKHCRDCDSCVKHVYVIFLCFL